MVRSSVYRMMGGLDRRFFAHMEEIDMCWRMQLEGWKVTVVPSSTVWHVGGGTLPATSSFKLFLNYRNNLLMLENNLSKTFALGLYHKGLSAGKAAVKGFRMARRRIVFRRLLDRISGLVYLVTLKGECFKAVLKAHKEYRCMKQTPTKAQIRQYLEIYGTSSEVTGIYRKWIILTSMLKGQKVFEGIRKEDFYKF